MHAHMPVLTVLLRDAIQANQCLGLAEIKGCQVQDWIVEKGRY